jgi:hypothetical protein
MTGEIPLAVRPTGCCAAGMLQVQRRGLFRPAYTVSEEGRPLASWRPRGGGFEVGGIQHDLRSEGVRRHRLTVTDRHGATLARAENVGAKRWTLTADARTHTFERQSAWGAREVVRLDGTEVGWTDRASRFRGGRVGHLPTMTDLEKALTMIAVLIAAERRMMAAGTAG